MPIKDNLIAYWELEEASGTRVDSHGSNDLTDNNTVTQAVGKQGSAGQFTRVNSEYLSIADNAALSVADIDFTFAVWFYADTVSIQQALFGKVPSDYTSPRYDFQILSDNTFQWSVDAGEFIPTFSISSGQWYLVIVDHDSVNNLLGVSLNDVRETSAYSTGTSDDANIFTIGRRGAVDAQYFNGRIDEVGFWKRILTADERTYLYNSGNGRSYADLGLTEVTFDETLSLTETLTLSTSTTVTDILDFVETLSIRGNITQADALSITEALHAWHEDKAGPTGTWTKSSDSTGTWTRITY